MGARRAPCRERDVVAGGVVRREASPDGWRNELCRLRRREPKPDRAHLPRVCSATGQDMLSAHASKAQRARAEVPGRPCHPSFAPHTHRRAEHGREFLRCGVRRVQPRIFDHRAAVPATTLAATSSPALRQAGYKGVAAAPRPRGAVHRGYKSHLSVWCSSGTPGTGGSFHHPGPRPALSSSSFCTCATFFSPPLDEEHISRCRRLRWLDGSIPGKGGLPVASRWFRRLGDLHVATLYVLPTSAHGLAGSGARNARAQGNMIGNRRAV